jgi:hypothetical protein
MKKRKVPLAGHENHVRMRILAEILLASKISLDETLPIGSGFHLSDILTNAAEFSGHRP